MPTAKPSISVVLSLLLSVQAVSAWAGDDNYQFASASCDAQSSCECLGCESADPWKLFGNCAVLDRWGIGINGHLEQGVTTNSRNPTNPAAGVGNFPATQMNYRNDEYMLNSLYLTLERKTDTGGSGWDIGGQHGLGTRHY